MFGASINTEHALGSFRGLRIGIVGITLAFLPLYFSSTDKRKYYQKLAKIPKGFLIMSPFTYRIIAARPRARSVAIAALLGATLLAGPLAAQPAPAAAPALTAATPKGAAKATEGRPETVEQRITSLHASLKITAGEEANWTGVATAMRENAAAIQKLIDERNTNATVAMTAPQDLDAYAKWAQAHVDGLKNLNAAFSTLYNGMPDPQKKIADQVFQDTGSDHGPAHS
jgi:protein CpxP